MDGDRRGALRGRPSTQFKKKGPSEKGRRNNIRSEHHEKTQVPNPSDTVYRILCPSRKIGSVIGKSGGIIKVLREETRSKITVSDTIPGSDERVIMIYSPPDQSSKKESDQGNVEPSMPPLCPAQDALLRVHDRIIEEDLLGGNEAGEGNNIVVTARLLVPNSMVGCLLGKGGDVIQRLRSETGATIRVLPSEHLPSCALLTDELVQIQGKPVVVKRALYEVSTLLHQNPRKETAFNFPVPSRAPGFHPAGPPITNLPPAHDPMWSPRHRSPRMLPPPWMDEYERHPGFTPGRFDDDLPRPGMEPSGEFSMKILCLASKIGGVIGRGGINVRQLQEDTGTSIHVEDDASRSEERVIRVSAFETLANPRSQTIDAILLLQNQSSEVSDKGVLTTRLLVPSNKVGCLLGQGGTIINEMRRRTHADIRVYSKDEKPECASEDEELVQLSGSFAVAKDALAEIASRLRARCLRDATAEVEPPLPRAFQGYGPAGNFTRAGPPLTGPRGISPPRGYIAPNKGAMHDYEPPSYPVQSSASRYPIPDSSAEARYQSNAVVSNPGVGGSTYAHIAEAAGLRMKLRDPRDPYVGGPDSMADIRGSSDHYSASSGIHHNYNGQNVPHQGSYPNPKGQVPYHNIASQAQPATYQSPYQNHNKSPYQNHNQNAYQNHNQTAYQNHNQTAYPNHNQTTYPNHSQTQYPNHNQTAFANSHQTLNQQTRAQQSPYQNVNAQHTQYQSVPAHGAYQY